ncbi:hypothetical protein C8R47DRAFT_1071455 [Mycena vitilis]|nr:hypothetical protein C8R47DRAFT_1071455 [Mycena vitilis]
MTSNQRETSIKQAIISAIADPEFKTPATPPSPDTDEDAGQSTDSTPVAAQHLRTAYRISSLVTSRTLPDAVSSQTTGLSEAFSLKRKNYPAGPDRSPSPAPPTATTQHRSPLTPRKAQHYARPPAHLKPPPAPVFSGLPPASRTPRSPQASHHRSLFLPLDENIFKLFDQ